MEQTSLRNRRGLKTRRDPRESPAYPRVLDPAPVNTGMNRLKPQPGLAQLPTLHEAAPGAPLPSL